MAVVNRLDITAPVLPKEVVEDVKGLGGDVVVTGVILSMRNKIYRAYKDDADQSIPDTLAVCVLDATGEPVFTSEQWQAFGATSDGYVESIRLFQTAFRLSGLSAERDKKK